MPKLGIFKRLQEPKEGYLALPRIDRILLKPFPVQQFIFC